MHIVRAEALGFCFGVRDALAAAAAIECPAEVTIHGQLVHNEIVLGELAARGFRQADEGQRQLDSRPTVLITAHGVSEKEHSRLMAAGKQLIDCTCPLVRRAHRAARMLAAEGRHVLVLGRPGHVEVRGIVDDLPSFDVIPAVEHVRNYARDRLGVVCQTTTSPRLAEAILAAIHEQNAEADVRFIDTICQPTRDRQQAVARLLEQVDAVVIVGGRHSNNTRELAELCRTRQKPAFHVQSAADLEPCWFSSDWIVGLTAGTSTPDALIDEVEFALTRMGKE